MLHPEMERFRVMRDQVHTEELEKRMQCDEFDQSFYLEGSGEQQMYIKGHEDGLEAIPGKSVFFLELAGSMRKAYAHGFRTGENIKTNQALSSDYE